MGFFEADWMIDDTRKLHKALRCIDKLNDQSKLKRAVLEAPRHEVRAAAMTKISDQAILSELAKDMPLSEVRRQATTKLTNQELLVDIAQNETNVAVRTAAIETLTDQSALCRVAVSEKEKDLVLLAIDKLAEIPENQATFAELVKTHEDWKIRYKAAQKLEDQTLAQEVFSEVVRYEELGDKKRKKLVKRLTNQDALAYVAKLPTTLSKNVWEMREIALERISDRAILADVAKNASEEAIRNAAAKKLNALMN